MAHAVVVNKTRMPLSLQAMVNGKIETIQVPPTLHGKPSRVPPHFVTWQEPHPDQLHVLHFVNNQGLKCDKLDDKYFPPTMPVKEEATKAEATKKPEEDKMEATKKPEEYKVEEKTSSITDNAAKPDNSASTTSPPTAMHTPAPAPAINSATSPTPMTPLPTSPNTAIDSRN